MLSAYHTQRETSTGLARDEPVHDFSSHACDALRLIAEAETSGHAAPAQARQPNLPSAASDSEVRFPRRHPEIPQPKRILDRFFNPRAKRARRPMSMSEEEHRRQAEALWHEHDEMQRLIEERCRLAEERSGASSSSLACAWLVRDSASAAIRHLLKRAHGTCKRFVSVFYFKMAHSGAFLCKRGSSSRLR